LDLSAYIEHTSLSPDTTPARVEQLCFEAIEYRMYGVCVPPLFVSLARRCLRDERVRIVSVVGFPFGANKQRVKAAEAEEALRDGAHELDMVMALGLALAGDWKAVEADIRAVRKAVPDATLKVIIETGYFEREQIRSAVEAVVSAGGNFVKTSSGYGPRGATVDDVALLYELAAGRAGVKASGGIRSADVARQMIGAGASRIGTSAGVALLVDT
jgi:deoxyribose-phosphate aldolase